MMLYVPLECFSKLHIGLYDNIVKHFSNKIYSMLFAVVATATL